MKHYALALLALLTLLAGRCKDDQTDGLTTFKLNEDFQMQPAETATLDGNDGTKITFNKVVEDSRCPEDSQCIWAGSALVQLTLTQAGETTVDTLATLPYASHTDSLVWGDYVLRLKGVTPYPQSVGSIDPNDYRVVLRVEN